jgi:hypothetical protein
MEKENNMGHGGTFLMASFSMLLLGGAQEESNLTWIV